MCRKYEHHCMYEHGWLMKSWCDQCVYDWTAYQVFCCERGAAELANRLGYESVVEGEHGRKLSIRPEPPLAHQLVLPWEHDEPSAEEVAQALARRSAGCAWSLAQLSTASPN
jgi:hypothetical protein